MSERAGQRIAAFALAGVFLLSSVALTGFVIWQIKSENDKLTSQTTPETPAVNGGAKLKGTKLEDFTPLTAQVSEIQSTDIIVGTGDVVAPGASITVHYTGALASTGVIFESSKDSGKPASFPLSGVIQGWQQGVPGMKVGGKRRLVIPASLAYGDQASATIPANSDLVFDIELISIP